MGAQSTLTSALLVFVGVAYVAPLWSQNFLNVVDRTWSTKPIHDVKLIKALDDNGKPINGIQCPPGYELSTSALWEGSYKTCDCNGIANQEQKLYKGKCSSSQRTAGCKDILEQQPREMDIIDGNLICVERYSEINFYDITRPRKVVTGDKTEYTCQDAYRLCGSVEGSQLCIQKDQPCPATDYKYNEQPTRESDFMPLVYLNVSEHSAPCISYLENNTLPEKYEHETIKNPTEGDKPCPTSYAGLNTDPFFRKVSTFTGISEKKILEQNAIPTNTPFGSKNFPTEEYKKYDSINYNLYQKSYPNWKFECYSDADKIPIDHKLAGEVLHQANDLNTVAYVLMGLSAALAFFSYMYYTWVWLVKKQYWNEKARSFFIWIRIVAMIALSGLFMFFSIKAFLVTDKGTIQYVAQHECSDNKTLNEQLTVLSDYHNNLTVKNVFAFLFGFAVFTCEVLTVVFRIRNKKQECEETLINERD